MTACHYLPTGLTQWEFCKIYRDSLSARRPGVAFTVTDDSTIVSRDNGRNSQYSIDNAYKEYQAHPGELKEILHRYLAASASLQNPDRDKKKENIVPIVKPLVFLDEVKIQEAQAGATKPMDMVYDVYNRDLVILYAFNGDADIQYMSGDDLKKLGIPRDSLRALALRNLSAHLDSIQLHENEGVYMPTAGGNYEASILLLGWFWNKQNLPVKGDFVIAVPSRDVLLITGSGEKDGVKKLREFVEKMSTSVTYPISDSLYRWDGKTFVPMD